MQKRENQKISQLNAKRIKKKQMKIVQFFKTIIKTLNFYKKKTKENQ